MGHLFMEDKEKSQVLQSCESGFNSAIELELLFEFFYLFFAVVEFVIGSIEDDVVFIECDIVPKG